MKTVVSGIRPTGNLHLGNYYGAIQNFIKMQHEYTCFFFIADWHSLTTHPTPENFRNNIYQVLAEYLACGMDYNRCTLYLQSDIPEIAELYLYFNMNAYLGELERSTSFKDKVRQNPDNVNAGLLTYPVLMSADVLIHRATLVPVGKDQEQHLEMMRNFALRFNRLYNTDLFPEPQAFNFNTKLVKVPGLDGKGKMGKSEGENNAIFLCDSPDTIRKKVMRSVTDSGPKKMNETKSVEIQNLFDLLQLVSAPSTIEHFEDEFNSCKIKYSELKKQLAEDTINATKEIREKIEHYVQDKENLDKVLHIGKEKAKASASETLALTRKSIGL